jgi:glycosyltransferase involved in cell wall biosynthesis
MRLNWFSPVPPTRSSIALDTATILPALAGRAEVVVWAHERNWARTLEEHATVRHYNPDAIPWREINAADVTVYHLGNEPNYHGAIWQVLRQHPGIVVLHDLNLQHFFAGSLSASRLSRTDYLRMMVSDHGARGRELAEAYLAGSKTVDEICDECPLTASAIQNALRVVVHTTGGQAQVVAASDRPVTYLPLFVPPNTLPGIAGSNAARRTGGPPYRLVIFGFLGRNRRLASVFKALHQFPGREAFHLDVYGSVADEKLLRQMVSDFGLKSMVTFHGFVEDAALDRALAKSDLALNLRDPTMGEASASQLRIWQHALPSLVTDIGWYATLPDNTVAKVRREAEIEDIQAHLAGFIEEPARYHEIGEAGRVYVNEHHTIERYLDGLMELIRQTIDEQPREAVRWIAERAGRVMSPWFAEEHEELLLPGVTGAIESLLNRNRPAR